MPKLFLERWFPPLPPGRIALYPGGRFAAVSAWITLIVTAFGLIAYAAVMFRCVVLNRCRAPEQAECR